MWKYGFTSVAGTAHTKTSLPCQDVCRAELVEDVLIAVVSDGAGSASRAHLGAALACELFLTEARRALAEQESIAQDFIETWIALFQQQVEARCDAGDAKPQDFACTLLAAVIGREQATFFQLGDGAMVAAQRGSGEYRCICWPQQGEYANTTNFLTDVDAAGKVFCEVTTMIIDEIALFTDGLQTLVLDYRTQSAHAPFFASMFAWLRLRAKGYSQELSDSLTTYLNSDKVNARTDDDKTLILATRQP